MLYNVEIQLLKGITETYQKQNSLLSLIHSFEKYLFLTYHAYYVKALSLSFSTGNKTKQNNDPVLLELIIEISNLKIK